MPGQVSSAGLWLICVDEEGILLDNATAQPESWVDRLCDEAPGVDTVRVGVDPLVILGLRQPDQEEAPRPCP